MKKFDRYLKEELSKEKIEIPNIVKNKIDRTLNNLPDYEYNQKSIFNFQKLGIVIGCFLFITLFLLPNISITYAKSLEDVPIIGKIIKIVTIRNYYQDKNHELDLSVPKLEEDTDSSKKINEDITKFTDRLIKQFYSDLEKNGESNHYSVNISYEVITNNKYWFTLKLQVNEIMGSSNTYYKYYHINKKTGEISYLDTIVKNKKFYQVVKDLIEKEMIKQMDKDEYIKYWNEKNEYGEDFVSITPNHNFYFDEEKNLVIPFDKYEIAPGYMGTPEFTIDYNLIKDYIKDIF